MTKIEEEQGLRKLVSECFAGGEIRRRELRLTADQAGWLSQAYPASVRPIGESWYEITFRGEYRHES